MILSFRSLAMLVASAGYAHAGPAVDERTPALLLAAVPASAWQKPALINPLPSGGPKTAPNLASFVPLLSSSFFGRADGTSRLLFLSPLSPLRAAWRVAALDLALAPQDLSSIAPKTLDLGAAVATEDEAQTASDATAAAKRRGVILRQRRKSVLNEREAGTDRGHATPLMEPDLDLGGFWGRVELLSLPSGSAPGTLSDGSIPNGAGLVKVSGYLTEDLSFSLTGLAAESAATTWRAGAEFELAAGDRNRIEVGAVYGTRFNTPTSPLAGEVDRRSVGAFRLVHALKLSDHVTTRTGGRFSDAPFLRSSRSIDPEFSVLIEQDEDGGEGEPFRTYLRLDIFGDTLFPGLEVVTGESDMIALSEGLPIFARDFQAQRTWNRGVAVGYQDTGHKRGNGSRLEARIQDQAVTHALFVVPSSIAGAPYAGNGQRARVQMGSLLFERTFARGQAQAAFEYGYGRFGLAPTNSARTRDFHHLTTRLNAYLRASGTGLAIFHRFHEGAAVSSYDGDPRPRLRAQRYLFELRQDVPFVPAMIGADMALLVSVRNVYYDDVDRRNVDEFAVSAPPRRITGGIRVKF